MLFRSKFAEAEHLLIKAVGARSRVLGNEHPDTLISKYELAVVYMREGKYDKAEPLFVDVMENYRHMLGEEHPFTLTALLGLAGLYQAEEKYSEAQALNSKVLEVRRRALGGDHPDTLSAMYLLADTYRRQGQYDKAEHMLADLANSRRRVLGPQHRDTAATLVLLGRVRIQQKKYADAESPLREATTLYENTLPDVWQRYLCKGLLGASLAGQGRYAESEPLLIDGYQGMLQREASIAVDNRSVLGQAADWILRLYQDWDQPEKVAKWRIIDSRRIDSKAAGK